MPDISEGPITWTSILDEAVTQWLEAEEAEPDGMTVGIGQDK